MHEQLIPRQEQIPHIRRIRGTEAFIANMASQKRPVSSLAFLKVACPSTQKTHFLRVDPEAKTTKQALESTLTRYDGDWERDLVAET